MQQSRIARGWLLLSVILGILSGGFIILQAYLLAAIISQVVMHNATRILMQPYLLLLLSTVLLRSAFAWLREWVNFKSGAVIRNAVRKKLLQKLFSAGPIKSDHLQAGAVSTAFIEQVEALQEFFSNYLPQMSLVVLIPIAIVAFAFASNWVCGIILLITAPLIPLFMALIGMGAESRSQKQFHQLELMSAHFLDVLRGLLTLKLFNQTRRQWKEIAKVSDDYRHHTMHVLRLAFLSSAILELFSSVSIAIIAVYLGLGLLGAISFGFHGLMLLKPALFILILAPEFFAPLRQLGTFYHARAHALGAAEELAKILELESKKTNQTKPFKKPNALELQLNNISFAYPNRESVLIDFNLHIKAGEHVVLVGESGAGKSTILRLIAGFIEPNSGEMLINTINLASINPSDWRNTFTLVSQNTRLFAGTIRSNLLLAKPNATDKELDTAMKAAYIDQFLAQLPRGIDTPIGDHNAGLSQGQVQRIALCRAYLKDTPLLLLDEPTANLDTASEAIILKSLQQLCSNKTTVTVTHRDEAKTHMGRAIEISTLASVT